MTRCALYLRVSRDDDRQTTENQRIELEEFASARGWRIVGTHEDRASGGKSRADRAGLDRMLADAERRRFDVLLFWSLDRLSREGVSTTFGYIERLNNAGVSIHCFTQPLLSTAGGNTLVRDVVIAVLAAVAQMEREMIAERTKAGLRRARREGKTLGRPSKYSKNEAAIKRIVRTHHESGDEAWQRAAVREVIDQISVSRTSAKSYVSRAIEDLQL